MTVSSLGTGKNNVRMSTAGDNQFRANEDRPGNDSLSLRTYRIHNVEGVRYGRKDFLGFSIQLVVNVIGGLVQRVGNGKQVAVVIVGVFRGRPSGAALRSGLNFREFLSPTVVSVVRNAAELVLNGDDVAQFIVGRANAVIGGGVSRRRIGDRSIGRRPILPQGVDGANGPIEAVVEIIGGVIRIELLRSSRIGNVFQIAVGVVTVIGFGRDILSEVIGKGRSRFFDLAAEVVVSIACVVSERICNLLHVAEVVVGDFGDIILNDGDGIEGTSFGRCFDLDFNFRDVVVICRWVIIY